MKTVFLILTFFVTLNICAQETFSLPGDGNWYQIGKVSGRHAYLKYKYSHSTAYNPSISEGEIFFINCRETAVQHHQTMGYGNCNQLQFAVINKCSNGYSELWVKASEGVSPANFILTDYLNLSLVLGDEKDGDLTDNGGRLKVYDKLTDNSHTFNGHVIIPEGKVGIGTTSPKEKLDINGNTIVRGELSCEEITVEDIAVTNIQLDGSLSANNITVNANGNTADFVFEDDYYLKDLSEVESFIKEHKHLPEIPSAAEMEASGVNLAEMNKLLLQKVEELTLYVIDLEKDNQQKEELLQIGETKRNSLEKKILNQEERLARIEALMTVK